MRQPQPSSTLAAPACAAALLAALAAGCATRPDTRVDQDPSVDLKSYKTFAFFEPLATDRTRYSTLLSGHLKQATRAQLERHDYVYSERNPDLRVNLSFNVADKMELRSTPGARGFYGYRGWGGGGIETIDYRQGTLMVDLVDARRNALVWQGVAEGRIGEKVLKNPGPAIDEVVGELFAGFPAGAAK